jgi:hypothetical protein
MAGCGQTGNGAYGFRHRSSIAKRNWCRELGTD